jgi:hypothetical protein
MAKVRTVQSRRQMRFSQSAHSLVINLRSERFSAEMAVVGQRRISHLSSMKLSSNVY